MLRIFAKLIDKEHNSTNYNKNQNQAKQQQQPIQLL